MLDNEYLDLDKWGSGSAAIEKVHSDEPLSTDWMRDDLESCRHEFAGPVAIEGDHVDELPKSIRDKVTNRKILLPEDCDIPIPPPPKDGWTDRRWGQIPIQECGEPLVQIEPSMESLRRLGTHSAYVHQNHEGLIIPFETTGPRIRGASVELFARISVVQTLHDIATYLPPGLNLMVLDGHRPPQVQNALFEVQVKRLMREQGMLEEIARKEAQKYVSRPSKNPPAPHSTGAAVDVAIYNHIRGGMLNFGTLFDDMSEQASSDYYENATTFQETQFRLNRRYLYWLMRIGNFRGWPFEWWHFDHVKDQVGAYIAGKTTAQYGYIHRWVNMLLPEEEDL